MCHHDCYQFVHAVRTGMTAVNGRQPISDKRRAHVGIVAKRIEMALHLALVPGHQIIGSRAKQALAIVPRSRDQRNSASERLEHPDGRDAWKHVDIIAAWHMNGCEVAREDLGGARIGKPPAIASAKTHQHVACGIRIAHTIHVEREANRLRRPEKEALQLGVTFVITPIADPDETFPLALHCGWAEQARIGGLVPYMHPVAPTPTTVNLRECIAKGQHPIISIEIEAADGLWIADRTMMRVMKQKRERSVPATDLSERRNKQ